MSTSIYWFRNDLRITDNPAFVAACAACDELLPIYIRSPQETEKTPWGFPRWGPLRRRFRDQALAGLGQALGRRGAPLVVLEGQPESLLPAVAAKIGASRVYCEIIAAPEEMAELAALRQAGLDVHAVWQSSLLSPADLPFEIGELPEVFTAFRHAVERAGVSAHAPMAAPARIPHRLAPAELGFASDATAATSATDPVITQPVAMPAGRSSFPIGEPGFDGSERSALAHVARYFASLAPQTYKQTRNGLIGTGYSTKFSPWLAVGSLTARTVFEHLQAHETRIGANEGTYWIWFELLWRDFFRFWSLKHGVRLFGARGLGRLPAPAHHAGPFSRWCAGTTGHAFVDSGMRELAGTGYLSNRMRQVVASYLLHELDCDWRAGAAWFESRLIDYDVCSNHGNWLYLAGRGTDPRQGRWFDPDKQAAVHDPEGAYRAIWTDAHHPL